MSCSCCHTPKAASQLCPQCQQKGMAVSQQTMLHQVQFPDNQSITQGEYAFCANRDCEVGYFSASSMIPQALLRAFQPHQHAMLCHCFDISESDYRAALADGRAGAIKSFVVQQTKHKLCACEARNPSGGCCLADFKRMEKAYDC